MRHHRPVDRRWGVLARVFTVCGVLLVPWIGVLIEQLHGQAGKRSFDSSWVWLDVLEAVCLPTVARLLSRRHRATSPAAAAAAAVLCMDAWFDTMSAAPQVPYVESLVMACFAELPLAALLAWTAWRALEWAAPRAAAARPASVCDPSPEGGLRRSWRRAGDLRPHWESVGGGRVTCANAWMPRNSRDAAAFPTFSTPCLGDPAGAC